MTVIRLADYMDSQMSYKDYIFIVNLKQGLDTEIGYGNHLGNALKNGKHCEYIEPRDSSLCRHCIHFHKAQRMLNKELGYMLSYDNILNEAYARRFAKRPIRGWNGKVPPL